MKRVQQGFTLIELMIVVAIVGILAAIALPAYQDFIVRSKMSEGTAALAACKTSVQDYISSHAGTTPTTSDDGGLFHELDAIRQRWRHGCGRWRAGGPQLDVDAITQNTGATLGSATAVDADSLCRADRRSKSRRGPRRQAACDTKYVPSSFR